MGIFSLNLCLRLVRAEVSAGGFAGAGDVEHIEGKEVTEMPFGDGTGPMGQGSMTGRGMGFCTGFARPGFANPVPVYPQRYGYGPVTPVWPGWGYGFGRGFGGRGLGRGFGRGWRRWGPYTYPWQ
ncbi:MAG: DUF5320 domain-containing protein [Dehalococcoidia bacterium]